MLHAWGAALLEGRKGFQLRYQWTDWARISPHAAIAVIAAEDQLFRDHRGFDFHAITRAMNRNRHGRTLRGASTITQQTAKNLFLYAGKSFWRKGLEAYFTVLMEALWPKRRILEVYLNIAQFGDGIYGIGAASEVFFHKPAASLTANEAALLAAALPNPLILKADKPSRYLLKRRQWILRQVRLLDEHDYLGRL
jgi:monofunctional biosynthetic peptidoglycan transglycosylase